MQEASQALRRVGEDLARLLGAVATGLRARPDRGTVERWLTRGREIGGALRAADEVVSKGEESLQFNHRARAEYERLERIAEARLALEHATTQTRGIVRSLLELGDAALRDPATAPVIDALSDLLQVADEQVAAFGRLQERPDLSADREASVRAYDQAISARDRAAAALREIPMAKDETARLLASILVDGERLTREVDVRGGAHAVAVQSDAADPT